MSAADRYAGQESDRRLPEAPGTGACDVDSLKSDTAELPFVSRALWVGTGGAVKVQMSNGEVATFSNIPDSSMLPIRVRKVFNTGTTATGVVALD